MAQSYITVVIAVPIVTIVLPQCTIATSQIVATYRCYVVADVPTTGHAIDLVSTCGLGCIPVVSVLLISLEFPNSEVIWQYGNIYFRYGQSYDWSFHHIDSVVLTSFP